MWTISYLIQWITVVQLFVHLAVGISNARLAIQRSAKRLFGTASCCLSVQPFSCYPQETSQDISL